MNKTPAHLRPNRPSWATQDKRRPFWVDTTPVAVIGDTRVDDYPYVYRILDEQTEMYSDCTLHTLGGVGWASAGLPGACALSHRWAESHWWDREIHRVERMTESAMLKAAAGMLDALPEQSVFVYFAFGRGDAEDKELYRRYKDKFQVAKFVRC